MGEVDSDSLILQVKVEVAAGDQMGFGARYDYSEVEGAIYLSRRGW